MALFQPSKIKSDKPLEIEFEKNEIPKEMVIEENKQDDPDNPDDDDEKKTKKDKPILIKIKSLYLHHYLFQIDDS